MILTNVTLAYSLYSDPHKTVGNKDDIWPNDFR